MSEYLVDFQREAYGLQVHGMPGSAMAYKGCAAHALYHVVARTEVVRDMLTVATDHDGSMRQSSNVVKAVGSGRGTDLAP